MTKDHISAGLLALSIIAGVVCVLAGQTEIGAPLLTLAVGIAIHSPVTK
jgi:hypothetical protein